MSRHFDDIVIGAGQAGPYLAARLSERDRSVALVERKLLGGTCVNTGCTPTKTMIASAAVAQNVRNAARFGTHHAGDVRVSLPEVNDRAVKIVRASREGLRNMLSSLKHCTVIYGAGCFLSPHELQVAGEVLDADRFFINVGARPNIPTTMPGVSDIPYLTSSSILRLAHLPEHLLIVGGGYIGLEFGQMFRRFGSRVTVIEMGPRLAKQEDPDVSEALADLLTSEGIHVRLNAECIAFSNTGVDLRVHVNCRDGDPEVMGSDVLLAIGRVPNTDDLGLSAAGVKTDSRGYITVDERLQTSASHIWAMGDCNGRGAFTHTSYNDFEIVSANVLDGGDRRVTERIQAHALYTEPPLAQIGLTESQVRASGSPALIATRSMSKVNRAVEKSESLGFMKVLVNADTKRILGASILGVGGDEAIHSLLDTMYANAPYTVLTNAVHIHPTVSELIPTLLGGLRPLV